MGSQFPFPPRAFPGQVFILMSLESSAYYPHLDDPAFRAHFDLTTTYRLTDDMPYLYPPFDVRASNESAQPGFEDRAAAVLYINSNCFPLNDRNRIVQARAARGGRRGC